MVASVVLRQQRQSPVDLILAFVLPLVVLLCFAMFFLKGPEPSTGNTRNAFVTIGNILFIPVGLNCFYSICSLITLLVKKKLYN